MQQYISTMNRNTYSSKVWSTINRIRGQPQTKMPSLQVNNRCIASILEIANTFATAFETVSSEINYPKENLPVKNNAEREILESASDGGEEYNVDFSMHELHIALDSCKATSPGPDNISN